MNQEEAKKWVELFQAVADGWQLQFYSHTKASWVDVCTPNSGDWPAVRYRVKPKPVELEFWYNPNPKSYWSKVYLVSPGTEYFVDEGYTKIKMRQVLD